MERNKKKKIHRRTWSGVWHLLSGEPSCCPSSLAPFVNHPGRADVKCSAHSLILIIVSYHWWEIRGNSAILSFDRLHFFSLLLLLQASFHKWVIATDPLLDSTSQLPLPQLAYPIRWQHFCRQERLTFQTLVFFPWQLVRSPQPLVRIRLIQMDSFSTRKLFQQLPLHGVTVLEFVPVNSSRSTEKCFIWKCRMFLIERS